jgi:hypothetical protein
MSAVATMEVPGVWSAGREIQWVQANHEELVERLARAIRDDGAVEPLPGLRDGRANVLPPSGDDDRELA